MHFLGNIHQLGFGQLDNKSWITFVKPNSNSLVLNVNLACPLYIVVGNQESAAEALCNMVVQVSKHFEKNHL